MAPWLIAVIVVLIVVAAYAGYTYWNKSHPVSSGFTNDPHVVTSGALDLAQAAIKTFTPTLKKMAAPPRKGEKFGGMDWPQSDTFGAMADTYPYGNYADGLQMFYPTYNEYAALYTRA